MALTRTDKKLLAIGGGMFAGGKVVDKVGGGGAVETGAQASTLGGGLALSYVGASELAEQIGVGSKLQMMKYGKDIVNFGRNVQSSARRAAPGLKLLAGRVAQGANRVI